MPPRRRGYFGFIEDESPSPEEEILEPERRTPVLSSFDPFNQEELWRDPTTGPERRTPETTHTSDSFNTAPVDSAP